MNEIDDATEAEASLSNKHRWRRELATRLLRLLRLSRLLRLLGRVLLVAVATSVGLVLALR